LTGIVTYLDRQLFPFLLFQIITHYVVLANS
jgi:hypothetical protein